MSHPGSRPRKYLVATGAALAATLALTGCSGGKDKSADKPGPPPPPPSEQPEESQTAAPGSVALKSSTGLKKPVTYDDKVTVAVSNIRYVRNKAKGPGEVTGKQLTIFTLTFTNGSSRPLDLNKVKVIARYGPKRAQASPTSYADLNDFYGTVAAGKKKAASYAFDLPATGYKSVVLGVNFDAKHKTAVFAGALRH
ncbi:MULTISPECIES: DUF4352 domain-containing protein [Actinomadura]|uniref:DUF4352 domain-containing protein n=1 Tax=Actinomadura yumaensis TaxID=111807 RepID=A0ABW2C9D1_9ACTN|nr:DUF4352 domain-containing protein [Actinomadura sp. J1-007]MWK34008.1 hypothetical protein [Actinomadura sp. J1-007]